MDREQVKATVLELLRDDPEVQGAVLAILAGAVGAAQPEQPAERRKPDWVLRRLAEEGKS